MITIDGSKGEGGGQILRTALSLAMCLKQPVEITKIRAGRRKPGLLRQHFTCADAARQISHGQIDGLAVGSESLRFTPGLNPPGQAAYHFSIGTAGSTSLVFQTLLPALLTATTPVRLTLEGGTHVAWAPTFDFLEQSFLATLAAMGIDVSLELQRCGFFPAGGGRWSAVVNPWRERHALALTERGPLLDRKATALLCNLPNGIAQRELAAVGWPAEQCEIECQPGPGTGNAISLALRYENINVHLNALGEVRRSAENVARGALKQLHHYQRGTAPVCEFLADQLLLPLVIGNGGQFATQSLSPHTLTNIDVIQQMTDCPIVVEKIVDEGIVDGGDEHWLITIPDGLKI